MFKVMEKEEAAPKKRKRKTKNLTRVSGRGGIKGAWTQADLPKIIKKLNKLFGNLEYLNVENNYISFRFEWKLADLMGKKTVFDPSKKKRKN